MNNCIDCIHNEVCLYIREFTFGGTSSVTKLKENADLYSSRLCGHSIKK